MHTFTCDEDVDRFVARHGVDLLRELVRDELMRSTSQFFAVSWLSRYDARSRREAQVIWKELKETLRAQILV